MPDTQPPAAAPQSGTIAAESLEDLAAVAATCTRCRLHRSRTVVVFGEGERGAPLMLVGEAPGRHEDLQGRPFVGALGNVLETCLTAAGFERGEVYLTGIVKCRPPEDRHPQPDEIGACAPYLQQQIGHVAPRVIVALGPLATNLLLRRRLPLEKVAGYRFDAGGRLVIPTYHPRAVLRGNAAAMQSLRRDLRVARAVLDGHAAGRPIEVSPRDGEPV